MFKVKDKKAFIFYFLMSIIFLDLGNGIKKLSYSPQLQNFMDGSFISIFHIHNTGGAFSILQNQTTFLIILSICTLLCISVYVYKDIEYRDKASLVSLTLFSAGTLGNLIERIQGGQVIDYFKLNLFDFPIFNAFDVMICLGIFIYIVFVIFEIKIPPLNLKKVKNENSNN